MRGGVKRSGYARGRDVEYRTQDYLRANGYDTMRAASSKGIADVIGVKPGQVVLVNVKRTTMPGPAERAELLRVAALLPGLVPVVAIGLPRLHFWRLTGPGPRERVEWSADEVAA